MLFYNPMFVYVTRYFQFGYIAMVITKITCSLKFAFQEPL